MDADDIGMAAKSRIHALGRTHGITADKSNADFLSDKFAELSGDVPVDDEVTQLCTNLCRAGVITRAESTHLLIAYLSE